jgi:hypothetical protein
MTFLRKFTTPTLDIEEVMDNVNRLVVQGMEERVSGFMDSMEPGLTSTGVQKLWQLMSPGRGKYLRILFYYVLPSFTFLSVCVSLSSLYI